MTTFSKKPCRLPSRDGLGAVISMQVAAIRAPSSDTKTNTPWCPSVSLQILSARASSADGLTSETANRARSKDRATRGPFPETGVYLDGCFRVLADRDKLHQAVKPLVLMERLVMVAPEGGLVVDPFAGSGTTVVAGLRQGRRVIGMEIRREWVELARERVRADVDGSDYASRVSGQQALFGCV